MYYTNRTTYVILQYQGNINYINLIDGYRRMTKCRYMWNHNVPKAMVLLEYNYLNFAIHFLKANFLKLL